MSIAVQSVSPSTLAGIDPQLVSNAGVVVLDDFLVMIDAGMRPDSARSLRADLEARTGRPVRYFSLTHYHADHAFSLAAFKDTLILASDQVLANLASSPDWTPQALAAMKKNHPPGDWVDEVKLVPPSLVFSDRLEVRDGQRAVEFHHSGGHTSCSVWAHLPDERVLFAGDLLFSGEFPYAGDPTCDPERWMETLRGWLTLDIQRVIPGHGPLADLEEVRRQLNFFEALKANTLTAIGAGKGPQDIVIPRPVPGGDSESRRAEKARLRWHAYYSAGAAAD